MKSFISGGSGWAFVKAEIMWLDIAKYESF